MPNIPDDRYRPGRRPRNIPRRRPPPSTLGRELGDDPYGRPGLRVAGGGVYDLPEAEFQSIVLEMAEQAGWDKRYHTYDSRRSEAGFPDLVLVRDCVLWIELKSSKGALTPPQKDWLEALAAAGQECHVWRPKDLMSGLIWHRLNQSPAPGYNAGVTPQKGE